MGYPHPPEREQEAQQIGAFDLITTRGLESDLRLPGRIGDNESCKVYFCIVNATLYWQIYYMFVELIMMQNVLL